MIAAATAQGPPIGPADEQPAQEELEFYESVFTCPEMGSLEIIETSVFGSSGNIAVTCTYRKELSSAPTISVCWDKPGSAITSNCRIEAFDEFDPGGATVLTQLVSGSAAVAGEYQSVLGDFDALRPYFAVGTEDSWHKPFCPLLPARLPGSSALPRWGRWQ